MKLLHNILGIDELKKRIEILEDNVEKQEVVITTIAAALGNQTKTIIIIIEDLKRLFESLKLKNDILKNKNANDIYN